MHLTNYSINKSSENFIAEGGFFDLDIFAANQCSKRTLSALWRCIMQEYNDETVVQTIIENIKKTCAGMVSMLAPVVQLMVNPKRQKL